MAFVFSGSSKLITLSAGTVVVDVRDLWSRWVDWHALGDNSKYLPAFRTVGGDVIDAGAGTSIPTYAYLLNGWRLRPQEANHTLTVNGGVLLVDGGGDPFVATLGAFVVRVNYQQPVQAIGFDSGGGGGSTDLTSVEAKLDMLLNQLGAVGGKIDALPSTGGLTAEQAAQLSRAARSGGSIPHL